MVSNNGSGLTFPLCAKGSPCFMAQQIVCLSLDLCVSDPKWSAFLWKQNSSCCCDNGTPQIKHFKKSLYIYMNVKKKSHNFSIDQKERCPHLGKSRWHFKWPTLQHVCFMCYFICCYTCLQDLNQLYLLKQYKDIKTMPVSKHTLLGLLLHFI